MSRKQVNVSQTRHLKIAIMDFGGPLARADGGCNDFKA